MRKLGENHRVRVVIKGAVQGVGFRPFVYRLATELGLEGWVSNSARGVLIEAEGAKTALDSFLVRLSAERPPRSFIQSFESTFLDCCGFEGFSIRASVADDDSPTVLVLPDIAVCDDCLREMLEPSDRRYRYPFINCTNCGPRFSIIEALPYDRPSTTMKAFAMCPACRAEYEDPANRRFHAQPIACPACGPQIALWDCGGNVLRERDEALAGAIDAIREGLIVAVKGLGGFHLVVDACNEQAVARLRQRKLREEKPFALMFPSLDAVRQACSVSPLEERLLLSPEAPIVLLERRSSPVDHATAAAHDFSPVLASNIAPGNPELGVMLPYTPLHHLLLRELGSPVVATSGNLSDEPICTDERDAIDRLRNIADLFLVHDRPIARHVDDSVARIVLGREMVLRRARGYAPLPVGVKHEEPPIIAVGAHLKNTIALCTRSQAFISQHIGDLETEQAFNAFRRVISDFRRLYAVAPSLVACDMHPDYLSTAYAREAGLPVVSVQHHEAHVLSCIAENELHGSVLGVSWDGTGLGDDGTIWGGEFLLAGEERCDRVACLRTFSLPGGDRAVKEPRRSALGVLYEAFHDDMTAVSDVASMMAYQPSELRVLLPLLERRVNTARTSSAGRLFDAVASITGLYQQVKFEGQAAMALQFAADTSVKDDEYEVVVQGHVAQNGSVATQEGAAGAQDFSPAIVDWEPMVRAIVDDVRRGVPVGRISARFHNALATAIVRVAEKVGEERVVLTGGCFQNTLLLERTVERLRKHGLRPYWHQRVPPNDGGVALGQVVGAIRRIRTVDSRP